LHLLLLLPCLQAEKLLLAEGSKLALVALESSYNQGVYGLVANLGSLVVRLLFTPVEEAAFTAFSR
jgi:oligosaccharide translocation protein RFT1